MTESPASAGPGQWLGQSEAASRLGWRLERLRAAARRGRLHRRKGNTGQWLVFVPDELTARTGQGGGQGTDSGGGQGVNLRATELEELHALLEHVVERA